MYRRKYHASIFAMSSIRVQKISDSRWQAWIHGSTADLSWLKFGICMGVAGMRENVFFLNHEHREDEEANTKSHVNDWEAEMTAALALHIIKWVAPAVHPHSQP